MDMTFRIVQITDTHIYADINKCLYGVNTNQSLIGVVEAVLARDVRPDLLVLTGDLVHDDGVEAYQRLNALLQALPVPGYVIPGNHDVPEVMRSYFSERELRWLDRVCVQGWQLLFLDSSAKGEISGVLKRELLAALRMHLDSCGLPTVIFLHHHVLPVGSAWLDRIGLVNANEFLAEIKHYPQVKAVVNGHVHQEFEYKNEQGVYFWGTPSSCAQFKPAVDKFAIDDVSPGWRVIELTGDGEITSHIERVTNRISA